ncbi:MAG: sodium:solute symporter family transporter [Planctomycetota bacterium]
MNLIAQSVAGQFTVLDWIVVVGYMVLTTLLGGLLAGKQATIRDFFLGGRKLPWYAVSGSIIATEISAVTFVGVPAIVYAIEGNLTYLQLGIFGSILARIIVGYVFVPVYYQREIFSPYDYMAGELGDSVRSMTTLLFTVGGMLAQGARVYLTALILDLIIGDSVFGALAEHTGTSTMTWSIFTIGLIAVIWTLMGGITTVIWTDVILFLVFLLGGFVALGFIIAHLPGGAWESIKQMCTLAHNTKEAGPWGKFTFFDFDLSPAKDFTIWTAIIASTWGGLGSYGTDQLLAQRMFCCKGPRQARWAIITSSAGQIITTTMLFVGLGLFAYYHYFPLSPENQALVAEKGDRIFPIFILQVLPSGITGLLIAGIFAAAISSLDSILAALSQTTISAFYLPLHRWWSGKQPASDSACSHEDKHVVFVSRLFVIFWGIVLCLMAFVADAASHKFPEILRLALSMAGYAGGALLAGFMLAFLRLNIDGRGYMWSGPLSVLVIFALVWHQPWTHVVCWVGALIMLITWIWCLTREKGHQPWRLLLHNGPQTLILMLALAIMILINYYGYLDTKIDETTGQITYITVAWPWFIPIGSTVAFVLGYLLARRKTEPAESVVN